jgi:hypothetical protein
MTAVLAVVAACAPAMKPLPRSELDRPQRVLVVTLDRDPQPVSSWRPGMSLGLMFGSFGSGMSGGVDFTHENDGSKAVLDDLKAWDFQPELQRVFLSHTRAPGAWTWVDGTTAGSDVLAQIDDLYDQSKKPATLIADYAARNHIDKILVVDPIEWGLKRDEGFYVNLKGRLFEPTNERTVVWQGRGEPREPRRPFFVAGSTSDRDRQSIHQALLDSAAESAADLVSELGRAR